jgi:hypothetical protein
VTTGCAQKLQYHCLYPSQLSERERKKTQKTRQKKNGESAGKTKKRRETINQQGLPFGLCFHFLHIRSAEQGRRKCRKPEERERNEDCRGEAQKKNAKKE